MLRESHIRQIMTDLQIPYNYLRPKFEQWKAKSGNVWWYVAVHGGRAGLINEFMNDINLVKSYVCPYIRQAGYAQSRNLILQAAEGIAGIFFDFRLKSTVDIILGALMDVCGLMRQGDELILRGL